MLALSVVVKHHICQLFTDWVPDDGTHAKKRLEEEGLMPASPPAKRKCTLSDAVVSDAGL